MNSEWSKKRICISRFGKQQVLKGPTKEKKSRKIRESRKILQERWKEGKKRGKGGRQWWKERKRCIKIKKKGSKEEEKNQRGHGLHLFIYLFSHYQQFALRGHSLQKVDEIHSVLVFITENRINFLKQLLRHSQEKQIA